MENTGSEISDDDDSVFSVNVDEDIEEIGVAQPLAMEWWSTLGLKMERNVPCSVHQRRTFEFIGRKKTRKALERTGTKTK